MPDSDWWIQEAEDAYNNGAESIGGAAALIAIAKILLPLAENLISETFDEEDEDEEMWMTHAPD